MGKQPIIAKITAPRLTQVSPRPRLFRMLDQSGAPVTWITGPAGSGKTTLVASWLTARKIPCLWYQLDEGDADLPTFFYYMGLAGRKAASRYKKALPLLTPEYAMGIPAFTRRYFENLYNRLKPPYYLVFDNYQEVPEGPLFQEMMRQCLSNTPSGINVIVISRTEPPPAFTGILAASRMHVLGWSDLRFTPDESKVLMRIQGIDDPVNTLSARLHDKTGGWAAGLVLLMRAAARENVDFETGENVSSEKVFDYFANELFDRLDGPTKDFLLKSALAPMITPELAEALTGNKAAARILSDLNRRNYFTEKRARPDVVYQYHSLFRAFLINRAANRFTSGELSGLQRETAKLLGNAGRIEDAAELYAGAKTWKELIPLILANAQTLIGQGRNKLLEKWIVALPDELLGSVPWLLYWLGFCRMPFDAAEGRKCFERSFRIFEDHNDIEGAFVAWSAIVTAIWHEWDDCSRMDYWIDWMENALKRNPSFASPQTEASVSAGMLFALSRRRPDHPSLTAWLERALRLTRSAPPPLFLQVRMVAFMYAITMWNLNTCEALLDELRGASKYFSSFDLMVMKAIEAQMCTLYPDQAEKGLREVQKNLHLADEIGIHFLDHNFYAIGTYCALNKGDLELAGEYLAKGRMIVSEKQRDGLAQSLCLAGWQSLLTGDISGSRNHAERALNLSLETGIPQSEALCRNLAAHILIKQGKYREASEQNASAEKLARRIGSKGLVDLCLFVEAQIAFSTDNEKKGLNTLRSAMKLGKDIDFGSLLFHWQPAVMADLCAKALENGVEVEYARRLTRRLQLVPDEPPVHIENWPWPVKIFTLGAFRVLLDDKPVSFSGKVQKKPLEMLKAIIASGGSEVSESQLTDMLWPEAEGDAAAATCRSTLHRLRQLIGHEKAVVVRDGRVSLNPAYCWTDAWAFERLAESQDAGIRHSALKDKSGTIPQLEKALQLYQGHFLAGDDDKPWTAILRERLKNKFLRAVEALGEQWLNAGEPEKAIQYFERGLEIDDLAEEFYRGLMACDLSLGRKAEAIKIYNRCKQALSSGLGVGPSSETEALYRSIERI